jgi:hypothetical protein
LLDTKKYQEAYLSCCGDIIEPADICSILSCAWL